MHEIKAGSTDQTIRFMLTKSDGTPYTGLLYNTPGLKCYYSRQGAVSAEIPLVDIPVIGTYTSSGFKAVDGANMPGYYELGIPDAAVVGGAKFVDIMISGPADLYVCPQRIRLTGIDLDDATSAGLSKIASLPASPAAVGSPMTLADGSITAEKLASNALSGQPVGSVVGNIGGSVNNIVSGVDLSPAALTAVGSVIDAAVDATLTPVADDIAAINTLVTRMMGPGDSLWEFPVFRGPAPSTTTLPGATVWITDDEAGQIFYAGPQVSDATGMTRWMVTTGRTYYVWCQMPHHSFSNPTEVTL